MSTTTRTEAVAARVAGTRTAQGASATLVTKVRTSQGVSAGWSRYPQAGRSIRKYSSSRAKP